LPNADKCHLLIPFKNYLKSLRVDADGRLDEASLAAAAAQEFENNKAIENRINDASCTPASTGGDWWAARTNTQQSIVTGVPTDITTWDEFQTGGAGSTWAYAGGFLTLPPGVYAVKGGGTWSSSTVDARLEIQHRPAVLTGIFIGQYLYPRLAEAVVMSFAGVDWYTDAANDMSFQISQNTGSNRNFDRMHWLVERKKAL